MEYPFKDLLPLDEVLAREGYYKDWTHLDPEVFYSLTQISNFIKTKGYGVDVRLLIAQLAEHFGLKTTQVVDLANLLQQQFTSLEGVTQSFTNDINSLVAQMEADKNTIVANATVDSEVILARGGKPTLQARLDETSTNINEREVNALKPPAPMMGAVGDGITDDSVKLNGIFNAVNANGGGKVVLPEGSYLITSGLVIPQGVHVYGVGFTESYVGNTHKRPTQIIKDGSFLAVDIRTSASLNDIIVDGLDGNLGDGIKLNGNSAKAENVTVTKMGGDGVVVGNLDYDGNRNAWTLFNVKSMLNKGNGFNLDDFTAVGDGGPDANGGMALKCNAWSNDGDGWYINRVASNSFIACYSEANKGYGWRVDKAARSNFFSGVQFEQNVLGDFIFEEESYNNFLITSNQFPIVDNGGNVIMRNNGGINQRLNINRRLNSSRDGSWNGSGLSDGFIANGTLPGIQWHENDALENEKHWDLIANNGVLSLRTGLDDSTGAKPVFQIYRDGDTASRVRFNPLVTIEKLGFNSYENASTLGNVISKIEVFNSAGVSMGFVPVYNSIN